MYHDLGRTSFYRPLAYPFRSLWINGGTWYANLLVFWLQGPFRPLGMLVVKLFSCLTITIGNKTIFLKRKGLRLVAQLLYSKEMYVCLFDTFI